MCMCLTRVGVGGEGDERSGFGLLFIVLGRSCVSECPILLHLMEICFLTCICLMQISQIQTRLFDVVGPELVSTSLVFVRSSGSHPAGPHGRLAQNTVNRDPIAGEGRFDTICTEVCDSSPACRLCRLVCRGGGGLIRNNITFNTTDRRPLIHTSQNFKWSRYTLTTLNTSPLHTTIYLPETAHYKTINTDIQRKHTSLSPHRRCEGTLYSLALVHL